MEKSCELLLKVHEEIKCHVEVFFFFIYLPLPPFFFKQNAMIFWIYLVFFYIKKTAMHGPLFNYYRTKYPILITTGMARWVDKQDYLKWFFKNYIEKNYGPFCDASLSFFPCLKLKNLFIYLFIFNYDHSRQLTRLILQHLKINNHLNF